MARRANLNLLLLMFVFFFASVDQAIANWYWPPSNVEINPQHPASSDVVDITLSGDWPDNGIPFESTILLSNNDIYLDVNSNHGPLDVITQWDRTESLGPLSPGTYTIYTQLLGDPLIPQTYEKVGQFNVTAYGELDTYVFIPEQSTVRQTGGFAGINETHTIEGRFQLSVDFDANTASFDQVDASLSESPYLWTQNLGELFNMTELVGRIISATEIEFVGQTADSFAFDINILLTFSSDSVHLTGQFPPPGTCCDFFFFQLDAVAIPAPEPVIIHVATDGNDITGDGSVENPFRTIQKGVDTAHDGCTVIVHLGLYKENINFLGKNITLTSIDPADSHIVHSTTIEGVVCFRGTENPDCTLAGFNIDGSITGFDWLIYPNAENHTHATISHCVLENIMTGCGRVIQACDGTISNCVIANITYGCLPPWPVPAIRGCHGLIKNCVMSNMLDGIEILDGGTSTIKNCIIYGSSPIRVGSGATLNISYCDLQGGLDWILGAGTVNWGPGNIDVGPCFVQEGYWEYIAPEYVYVKGDYHLKSQGWRWDSQRQGWDYDEITSRCIDAGNPGTPLRNELLSVPDDPNNIWGENLRINMGVYGGTAEASMGPHDWALLADLTNDGKVNLRDFGYTASDWLATADEQPGDLNRNGVVDVGDVGLMTKDWLAETTWHEP